MVTLDNILISRHFDIHEKKKKLCKKLIKIFNLLGVTKISVLSWFT